MLKSNKCTEVYIENIRNCLNRSLGNYIKYTTNKPILWVDLQKFPRHFHVLIIAGYRKSLWYGCLKTFFLHFNADYFSHRI